MRLNIEKNSMCILRQLLKEKKNISNRYLFKNNSIFYASNNNKY